MESLFGEAAARCMSLQEEEDDHVQQQDFMDKDDEGGHAMHPAEEGQPRGFYTGIPNAFRMPLRLQCSWHTPCVCGKAASH